MTINVLGASVDRQFIDGNPDRFEWRVSYQVDGRGLFYHSVSSRDAWDSMEAVEVARRQLECKQ